MPEKSLQVAVLLSLLVTTLLLPEAAFAIGGPGPPSIFIGIEPKSQDLQVGGSATFKVTVYPQSYWDIGNVTLSLSNPPQGVTATFNPEKMTITDFDAFSSTLTVKATADAPQGRVTLTVRGKGVEYSRTEPNSPSSRVNLDSQADMMLNIVASYPKTTVTTTVVTTTTTTLTTGIIQTQTVTQIGTSTNTLATTLTTTITTTAITEQASDTPNYAWALSATVATIVLAAVLISQRRSE